MNVEKLYIGKVIKNYKTLCELLNIEPKKDGKSKQLQLKDFERYFTYHKQGQKFIIDEIYDIPKKKIDKRKNNGGHIAHTTYGTLMDSLLINMLIDMNSVDIPISELLSYNIPLFSKNYNELLKDGYIEFAKKHNMSKGLVLVYQQKIKNIVEKCLKTTLNRLQKDNVLKWNINIIFTNSRLDQDFADEDITKNIKDAENIVYEKEGITPSQRINPQINKKFKKEVCKLLDDIISYWNVYSIELLDKNTKEQEEDINELIKRLMKSTNDAVTNKKSMDKTDENNIKIFYPYASFLNQED